MTISLMALSFLTAILTGAGDPAAPGLDRLFIASLSADRLNQIQDGEVWRLITPAFIHVGWAHLLGNMFWLYYLGRMIEVGRGLRVLAPLVLVSAVTSNLAQYIVSGPHFGGMSGVVYALFGYAWMYSLEDSQANTGIYVNYPTVLGMIGWFLLCMTGTVGPIANAAHLLGLVAGVFIGYFTWTAWRVWLGGAAWVGLVVLAVIFAKDPDARQRGYINPQKNKYNTALFTACACRS